MANGRYTIVVSGERLTFTRDQIESDPGNYFETYFFGEFSEGVRGARELFVEKDVQLFKLIQAHLRGYEIFPLPDSAIPSYMTREVALTNLVREAQFYGLGILEERIHAIQLEGANLRIEASCSSHLTKLKVASKYKFASYKNGDWFLNDITEEEYTTHFIRFLKTSTRPVPVALASLRCPGYTISVSWGENQPETQYSDIPLERVYALLQLDS